MASENRPTSLCGHPDGAETGWFGAPCNLPIGHAGPHSHGSVQPEAGGTTAAWDIAYHRVELPSVFPHPEEAYRQMRRYAERCDARGGRCKSCAFLLKALDEIALLRGTPASTITTTTP